MPSKSPAQHKLMEAAAHTKGGFGGVPQKVGKEFVKADEGKFKRGGTAQQAAIAISMKEKNMKPKKMSSGGHPGLYANINAKKQRIAEGSGEKMRKPGTKGAPTASAFKASAKTAKMAYGGSMDDNDDYDAPPRTRRNLVSSNPMDYDSDIDYYRAVGRIKDDDEEEEEAPNKAQSRAMKANEDRRKKFFKKNEESAKQFYKAKKSGDDEKLKQVSDRWNRRSVSEALRSKAKMLPKQADQARKEWSEKIGKGKPAPFKSGGKVNKSCW